MTGEPFTENVNRSTIVARFCFIKISMEYRSSKDILAGDFCIMLSQESCDV